MIATSLICHIQTNLYSKTFSVDMLFARLICLSNYNTNVFSNKQMLSDIYAIYLHIHVKYQVTIDEFLMLLIFAR